MEMKTIEKIKEIADVLVQGENEDEIKKNITKMNSIRNPGMLRQFFLKLIREHYNQGSKLPLVTLEDYVTYLLPDHQSWKEMRDLILIAGYEKLHEKGLSIVIETPEEENEEGETE